MLPMESFTWDMEAGPLPLLPGAGAASIFFSGALVLLLITCSSLRLFFIDFTIDRITLEEFFVSTLAGDHAAVHDYDHVAFLNGSLKVQGGNAVNFSGNKAESKEADAFGGAVYVTSSQKKPEEYGMFLGEGTYLNFNNNHAIGESAQGGAMVFVSGAINAKNSYLAFSGNTGAELKVGGGSHGVGTAPVFVIGVQKGHDVLIDCLYGETFCLVVGQCQFGILTLGELTLGSAVHLHQRSNVDILGQLEAQGLKQLDVEGQGRQPLVATDPSLTAFTSYSTITSFSG